MVKGGMPINIEHDANKIEMLRQRYPEGTMICLDHMEGEEGMDSGLKGKVSFVDDAGQIHMKWENGRTLPVIPGVDSFHRIGNHTKKREVQEPQR